MPTATPYGGSEADPGCWAKAHPRAAAGGLLVQLAAQQDDGAQVLHRDGEAQLSNQCAAARQCLQRDAAQKEQAGNHCRKSKAGSDEVGRVLPPTPQAEVAETIGGAGNVGGDRDGLPREDAQTGGRCNPTR